MTLKLRNRSIEVNPLHALLKVTIIGLILVLISPAKASSEEDRIEAERKSNNPVLNLLKEVIGEAEYERAMASKKYRYTGKIKCRLCHRKFFLGRKKDLHDHSFNKDFKNPDDRNNPKCLVCHTTGFGVPTGFITLSKTAKFKDVQCEGCHGPGSLHAKMDSKGGLLVGTDRPERIKKMCTMCHNKRWNRSFKNLDAAYKSYKKAEAVRAGIF